MDGMFSGTSAMTTLNTTGWDTSSVGSATSMWSGKNPSLVLTCDYGDLFGEPCN